jgi:hypothetical protein
MKELILAVLLAAPMAVSAAEGEVCIAKAIQPASEHGQALSNDTRFECLAAGKDTTLPEIYKKGWKVTSQFPQMIPDATTGMPRTWWTLVIEKI